MKSIAICYSEHAIKVSDSYCSGPNSNQPHSSSQLIIPSIQNAVSCIYKVKLSSHKQFLIRLTWCNRLNRGFCIGISDNLLSVSNKNFRIQHRESGSEVFESSGLRIEAVWDLRRAKYESGPEPVTGFYVVILVNSELSLILGDMEHALEVKKRISDLKLPDFSLISRNEFFSGNSVYSTRAKFSESGSYHDILIKCCGEERTSTTSFRNLVLSVYIDKKTVVQVKRLQWNFRGNQSIFLDGLLIDLMWDLHDWLFNPSGYGVFLFRTRRGLDSRLWLEDKNLEQDQHQKVGLSFLICASKNPD